MLNLIVAMTREGIIGKNNALPWRIPEELQHFQTLTKGKTIIMGRKTLESIGKPLEGRKNLVVSTTLAPQNNLEICRTLQEALQHSRTTEIFIIGGESIYGQTLSFATRLHLSWIHKNYVGDTYFPEIDWEEWRLVSRNKHIKFTAETYERK